MAWHFPGLTVERSPEPLAYDTEQYMDNRRCPGTPLASCKAAREKGTTMQRAGAARSPTRWTP